MVGSQTLTAGGSAITQSGQTISLATQSGSAALVVNGESTVLLPSGAGAATQLVTIGGQTFTAFAAPSSALIIDGVTLLPGGTATVAGETVQLSGTDLIIASGTATSTEGLGPAIISGLGGGQSSVTPAAYTGGAARRNTDSGALIVGLLLQLIYLR